MRLFNKNRRLFWMGLTLVLIVFLFFIFGSFRGLSKGATAAARPLLFSKLNLHQGFQNLSFLWQSKKSLLERNAELENLLEEYRLRLSYADFVAVENEDLKKILGGAPWPKPSFLATVLAGPRASFYDTLLVDLAAAEVTSGAKVITPPNILIGEVAEVVGRVAKIKLYSTPKEMTEARLAVSGTPVIAIGRGGGNFKIDVPREMEVVIDEPIVVPPDFLLGFVKKIEDDPRNPGKTIFASAPVNIFTLKHVFVLQ